MPDPDFKAVLVESVGAHTIENRSWIVGRILCDFYHSERPYSRDKASKEWEALRVTVFDQGPRSELGIPRPDRIVWAGLATVCIQLVISFVPLILHRNWNILMITFIGNVLASCHVYLPRWRAEKHLGPFKKTSAVTLFQGSGSRSAMVILGCNSGVDLGIHALAPNLNPLSRATKIQLVTLLCFWLLLLVAATGTKDDSWLLMAVAGVGMIHNLAVSAGHRRPGAFGVDLNKLETISGKQVSKVLMLLEKKYPLTGSSLLRSFYPGGFQSPPDELEFWEKSYRVRERSLVDIFARSNVAQQTGPAEPRP